MQRSRDLPALVGIWLVVAAFELTKAVHIDDAAYLQVARAIIAHPLHPMSALLNWTDTALPIHKQNMPHLLLYLMAAVMKAAPAHYDLALHVVWALFSGLAMALFYTLARALDAPRPLFWTAIFCLGPAFIPSQNLMLDVPLVAVWLAFFYALARPDESRGLGAAAVLVAVACLVKYTSLVLVPILALEIVRRVRLGRCRPATLCLLLIPVGALAGWSAFNWFDYGGIHILERPIAAGASPSLGRRLAVIVARAMLWVVALGALAPFTPAFVGPLTTSRAGRRLLVATSAIAAIAALIGRAALPAEPVVQSLLRGLFLGNGILVAGLAARARPQGEAARGGEAGAPRGDGAGSRLGLLGLWVFGAALFIVVLSPFIAVRHVLLALPAVLLLVARGPDANPALAPGFGARLRAHRGRGRAGRGLRRTIGQPLPARDARPRGALLSRGRPLRRGRPLGLAMVRVPGGPRDLRPAADRPSSGRSPVGLGAGGKAGDRAERSPPPAPGRPARGARDADDLGPDRGDREERRPGDRSGGLYYFWTSVPWTITARPLDRFLVYDVGSP